MCLETQCNYLVFYKVSALQGNIYTRESITNLSGVNFLAKFYLLSITILFYRTCHIVVLSAVNKVFKQQKKTVRAIFNAPFNAHSLPLFCELNILNIFYLITYMYHTCTIQVYFKAESGSKLENVVTKIVTTLFMRFFYIVWCFYLVKLIVC